MRLILSNYLRTLKERDEFDILIPDLLQSMNIRPITKGQRGTSQSGVDLAAVGKDITVDDEHETFGKVKLFLFVLKQGDIDRRVWNGLGEQSVQPSLDEIFNIYLRSHVPSTYKDLPIKIVLGTTGDLKENTQSSWSGYTERHKHEAEFSFWGANEVSAFVEQYMLNEHIFKDEDRADLRRTLALISEPTYSAHDFDRLLLRQLGLEQDGSIEKKFTNKNLIRAFSTVNLATRLVSSWAIDDGDTKAALKVTERAVLLTWHCLVKQNKKSSKLKNVFLEICNLYIYNAKNYYEKLKPYCHVKHGFSSSATYSELGTLVLFEHIGFLASIGLFLAYRLDWDMGHNDNIELNDIANTLSKLIKNNPASGSPRLDYQSIDMSQAFIFLMLMGYEKHAADWLKELVYRADYAYTTGKGFPVGTDNVADLIELDHSSMDMERSQELMQVSWTLPTLAGWCAILNEENLYSILVQGLGESKYKKVCRQLWHPISDDLFDYLYFENACGVSGECEAPITFPENMQDYASRMEKIVASKRHDIICSSPAYKADLFGIDFIASRHYRTPVAPSFWYKFLPK